MDISYLEAEILQRSERRIVSTAIDNLRYYNEKIYRYLKRADATQVLYIGIGHGHDALLALLDNRVEKIIGADPYISCDGNDEEDYGKLLGLVEHYSLENRLTLYKGTIEDFCASRSDLRFDAIFMLDVLHHIFITRSPITRSPLADLAVETFRMLRSISTDTTHLIVSEKTRRGLRPFLSRIGIRYSSADYSTKQQFTQWNRLARKGGWRLSHLHNYVPHSFRRFKFLENTPLGRLTLCDRYLAYYLPQASSP
ncbi:MAG: hypothetical protein JXD23_15895 [Spirochaetales bacterium]|nr:hypothetical protein [Spirochaetales bacterium]